MAKIEIKTIEMCNHCSYCKRFNYVGEYGCALICSKLGRLISLHHIRSDNLLPIVVIPDWCELEDDSIINK